MKTDYLSLDLERKTASPTNQLNSRMMLWALIPYQLLRIFPLAQVPHSNLKISRPSGELHED